jgi:hypothetical protein
MDYDTQLLLGLFLTEMFIDLRLENAMDLPSGRHGNDIVVAILVVGPMAGAYGLNVLHFPISPPHINIFEHNDL